MTDLLPVGVAPVEPCPGGYRIPGTARPITAEAAQHAKSQGALRYSPEWRSLALAFCAARDAATEAPAAGPRRRVGNAPGSSSSPQDQDPGAPQTFRGREGVGASAAVGADAPTSGPAT